MALKLSYVVVAGDAAGWTPAWQPRLLLARRDHHDHLPAFQLGNCSTRMVSPRSSRMPLQRHADFLVRDLAAPEAQRDLALVAFGQEAADVAQLDVVVTVVGARRNLIP